MKFKGLLMLLVLMTSISMASAATVNIAVQPEGDGFWQNLPGRADDYFNSGSATVSAHYQFWGSSSDVVYNTGFAQFSLDTAPEADAVTSAYLYLNIESAYLTGSTLTAGNIKHASNSASATGNASQRLSGNELVSNITPDMNGWSSFDVTSYIKNDIISEYNWSAFSFHPDTGGDYANRYAGFSFTSAEGDNPAFLRIITGAAPISSEVPEPGVILLFGAGLLALTGMTRKAK